MDNLNLEQKIENLQNEISSLKNKEKNFNRKLLKFVKVSGAFGIFCGSLLAFAQVVASLHIFNDGEIISASKINENFAYLDNKINSVSAGGLITEDISSHTTISLNSTDSGKLFAVSQTARFILPSSSDIGPGFNFKISMLNGSQIIIENNEGINLQGSSLQLQAITTYSGTGGGYKEFLFTGTDWISPTSSGVNYNSINPSRVLANGTCTGKGLSDANCYTNTTAMDTSNYGYVYIGNELYYYDTMSSGVWLLSGGMSGSSSKYLVNDPGNNLPAITSVSSSFFGNSPIQSAGGLIYFESNYSYTVEGMLNNETALYQHAGVNIDDYINQTIEANLVDSTYNNGYAGSSCQSSLGSDWRLITASEVTANSITSPNSFITASATNVANEYQYFNAGAVPPALETVLSGSYSSFRLLCVYEP